MTRTFSDASQLRLDTCHPDLQRLFNVVLQHYDCSILCGHRNEKDQNEAFRTGMSKLKWPEGEHNKYPSMAVDVAPCPVSWKKQDAIRFYHFAGFVKAVAVSLNIKIRWGGDWDSDNDLNDQTFFDLPHFELVE